LVDVETGFGPSNAFNESARPTKPTMADRYSRNVIYGVIEQALGSRAWYLAGMTKGCARYPEW
jgi:hypothetical protein